MIILRIIHIFAGVFWVGVAFFNIGYLQPTIRATGAEGQKVMRHLTQQTRFTSATYGSATLNMLSGLIMYWILSGFQWSFLSSGYGLVLTIGSIAGLLAWLVVIFLLRNIFSQMKAIGQQIQTQGGPPTAEQSSQMQTLGAQLIRIGQTNLVLLIIALVGMAAAQYAVF
jgi:uncharacterized membrane protein